jgi:hypothetical protein
VVVDRLQVVVDRDGVRSHALRLPAGTIRRSRPATAARR